MEPHGRWTSNHEGLPGTASTTWASHRPILACSYETPALASQCMGLYGYDHRDNIHRGLLTVA
eukprot:scaffold8869_cov136-Cylindrotheca_fusiformis.AAC.2